MFGNKIFSLIGLLILGHIHQVLATDKTLGDCTGVTMTECSGTPATYCLHSDGKIYGVANDKCTGALTSNVHVFNTETKKEINLSSGYILNTDVTNLVMYICFSNGCVQTVGYANIPLFTQLTADNAPADWGDCSNYFSAVGSPGTACSGSSPYAKNSYYAKDSNSIFKISKSGSAKVVIETACDATKIGLYSSTGVCLGVNSASTGVITVASNNYVLSGTIATGSVFSFSSGKNGLYLKAIANLVYIDNSPSSTTPTVVDTDTKKVDTVLEANRAGTPTILSLYNCKNGECVRTSGFVQSGSANYKVSTDGTSSAYTSKTTCNGFVNELITGDKYCFGNDDDSESVVISSANDNYILNIDNSYKFVRTSNKVVSVETLTGAIVNGLNMINKDTAKVMTFPTTKTLIENNLSDIALYQCDTSKKVCKQTYGYLKSNDETAGYYSIGVESNAVLSAEDTCSGTNYIGAMSSSGKLCLHGATPSTIDFSSQNKNYQLKDAGTIHANPFVTNLSNVNIIIEVGANYIIENKFYFSPTKLSVGVHLFEVSGTKVISELLMSNPTVTVAAGLMLYTCSNIKCAQTYGYIKAGDNYYAIKNDGTSASETTTGDCTSSSGLLKSNKLCKSNGDASPADFITTSTATNYIITPVESNIMTTTTAPILVKASQNAFSLNNVDGIHSKTHIIKTDSDYKAYTYTKTGTTFASAGEAYDGIKKYQKIDSGFFNEIGTGLGFSDVSDDTTLVLFDCTDATCTIVAGDTYIKEDDDIFSLTPTSSAKLKTADLVECTAENAGKITTDNKLCLGAGKNVDFLSGSEEKANYVIKVGSDIKLVEGTQNQFIIKKIEGTMKSGINVVNITDKKIFDLSSTIDAIKTSLTANIVKLALFDCGSNNVCMQTYGFIKSNDAESPAYYAINISGEKKVVDEGYSTTNCALTDNGKIKSDGSLCVKGNGTPESVIWGTMASNKEYFITTPDAATVFTKENSLKIIVKSTPNSYTLKVVEDDVNILKIDTTTQLVSEAREEDFKKTPNLIGIYTSSSNAFTGVPGYAISDGKYYSVTALGVASPYTITEVNTLKKAHCASMKGMIVKDYEKVYLCLDDDIHVELKSSNEGYYILGDSLHASSPFTAQKMVKLTDKYIIRYTTYEASASYVLKNDVDYYIYSCSGSNCNFAKVTANGIKLAVNNLDKNIYTVQSSNPDSTDNVVLFQCFQEKCKESKGYILISNTLYSNVSGNTWSEVEASKQVCAVAADIGKVKLDNAKTKIQLCTGTPPDVVDIGTDVYLLGDNYQIYNAANINTVIGLPDAEDGYYYIGNANKIVAAAATILVHCENKICTKKEVTKVEVGFYSNAEGVYIIKCTSSGDPAVISCGLQRSDGYFLDDHNNLVNCVNSKCSIISYPDYGYYENAGDTTINKYIQCSHLGCKAIPEPTEACDGDDKIGKLTNDGGTVKLCLAINKKDNTANTYIVNYAPNNAFSSMIGNGQYGYITISASSKSFTLTPNKEGNICVTESTMLAAASSGSCVDPAVEYACNADGVCNKGAIAPPRRTGEEETAPEESAANLKIECSVTTGKNCEAKTFHLVDDSTYTEIDADYEPGLLYYCSEEESPCTQVNHVGYYIMNGNILYSCMENEDNLIVQCEKSVLKDSETTCSDGENVGKILFTSGTLSLCVAAETPVEINQTNTGNYILTKNANYDLFGIGANKENAIVTINETSIVLNDQYTNKLKYVYANSKAKFKVIEKGDTCPLNEQSQLDTTKIKEYECLNGKCNPYPPSV